jgi:tetratricopeptide (TPR) repeat protein
MKLNAFQRSLLTICFFLSISVLANWAPLVGVNTTQSTAAAIQDDFIPPQSLDGSKKPSSDSGQQNNDSGNTVSGLALGLDNSNSQGQQIFEALFQELDNMIPGEFVEGSPQKKSIEDAVTAFQIQNIGRVNEIFKDLAANNKEYPPADLLLAALSYSVKDSQSGLILLERAAVEHPDYPGVYAAFARLAINQGRVSDALAMFEKFGRTLEASRLEPTAREHFEQQYLDGLIDVAMRQKHYDQARDYLDRQRASLPDNPKVLMVSAELEYHDGNVEESLAYLQQLKTKYPNTRTPESVLGNWFQQEGKTKEAEKWIRAAAEKFPNDAQVQLEFANWAISQEDFPIASSAIIKAEKATSESLFSRNLKGRIAFANQSYGVAEAHYRVIAEKQPNNFDASNMYALCLIESNDEKKQQLAREITIRNFRSLPDNVVAQAALGYVELKLGDPQQAKTILTRAARSAGTAPEIDYFLGALLAQLGESEQAQLLLDSALKHKGLFLYRSAAEKLSAELKSGADALPVPEQ